MLEILYHTIRLWLVRLDQTNEAVRRSMKRRHKVWLRRFRLQNPRDFRCVQDVGEPVGPPLEVVHITLHDMLPRAVAARMTDEVLLRGLRANAVREVSFKQIKPLVGIVTIQPVYVPY